MIAALGAYGYDQIGQECAVSAQKKVMQRRKLSGLRGQRQFGSMTLH